jgi:hypothetical protein
MLTDTMHPIFILALVAGGIAYMSYRNKRRLGLTPSGALALPPGPPSGAPGPVPTGPMAPWQVDPGMPPQYAHAVWTALAYEREPHRLRAFGERMREMRMHRAATALHGRAAALEHWHGGGHGGHGGHAGFRHATGQWAPTADCQDAKSNVSLCAAVSAALASEGDVMALRAMAGRVMAAGYPKAAQALRIKASMLSA